MKGFKRCPNGHFYKETLADCPHCQASAGGDHNKTQVNQGGGNANLDKTQVFGAGSGGGMADGDKTQVFGEHTPRSGGGNVFGAGKAGGERDFDKTFIGGVTDSENDSETATEQPRATRKITGWLVSFTIDPMGVDFRIYEGNNTIGRAPENAITITTDSTISSKHANILHKKGSFWIKDEMAANGTFVNGEELEIEKAYAIKDGDEIRLGDTVFVFKTWHS